MRSPLDLLEWPYSFSQLPLLTAEQFRREASGRGVELAEDELEALHRARLLVPMFRLSRDGRPIATALRHEPVLGRQLAHWFAPSLADLVQARACERLYDPAIERLVSHRQRCHKVNLTDYGTDIYATYETSLYAYSQHQLMMLPAVSSALGFLDRKPRNEGEPMGLNVSSRWKSIWQTESRKLRDMAIAASVLEPAYYPRVTGRLQLADQSEIEDFDAWQDSLSPTAMLKWLAIKADWLKESAAKLLHQADRIDPLRDWSEVVARADPEKWALLRGPARSAMDLRITTELFLSYHDELVEKGKATRIERARPRTRGPFDRRLKRTRSLDEVLTEFGLSPHPRLVLVVEGATELLLVPSAMQMLGISTDEDFISVQDAEGVDKDLNALMAFLAPRVRSDGDGRHLPLIRPPTRLLVVLDPEGRVTTEEARQDRRKVWVDRIHRAIPGGSNSQAVREQIDPLVDLITWNLRGESFEFAHFTDREIAAAILRLPRHERPQTLQAATATVAKLRSVRGGLDSMFPNSSKGRLAKELQPVLEAKIRRAESRGTVGNIAMVKVLQKATDLAYEFPRRHLVLGLSPRLGLD
jgi:hypothetical protein